MSSYSSLIRINYLIPVKLIHKERRKGFHGATTSNRKEDLSGSSTPRIGSEEALNASDSLDGEDVVPGFSLRVEALFEDYE